MSLIMTAAPAVEPITLAEAKAQLRVDVAAEDSFIASLIVTARLQIEAALGLALITQSWRWALDEWPEARAIVLPIRPVLSVEAVSVRSRSGGATAIPSGQYHLDGVGNPARIVIDESARIAPGALADGIVIELTAGFGPTSAAVPAPIRHGLKLLVAHWFENREPVALGSNAAPIPDTISTLLAPYRQVRL